MGTSRILPVAYNESTYGTAGAGRDYTSLQTWEVDTDNDLVTAAKGEVLTCYADASPYADIVTVSGATTNESYFRVIRAAAGQRGTPTTGVRFEKLNVADNTTIVVSAENYSSFYDIAAKVTCTASSSKEVSGFTVFPAAGSVIRFVGCTAYGMSSTGTSGHAHGFYIANNAYTAYIINCVAKDIAGSAGNTLYTAGILCTISGVAGTINIYVYNTTINTSNKYGISAVSGVVNGYVNVYAKNTIYQNCTLGNNFGIRTTLTPTTCAASGVTFADDGYHLAFNDSGAIGRGTNLSGDASFAFDDDIDEETRGGSWDIGCDKFVFIPTINIF